MADLSFCLSYQYFATDSMIVEIGVMSRNAIARFGIVIVVKMEKLAEKDLRASQLLVSCLC